MRICISLNINVFLLIIIQPQLKYLLQSGADIGPLRITLGGHGRRFD